MHGHLIDNQPQKPSQFEPAAAPKPENRPGSPMVGMLIGIPLGIAVWIIVIASMALNRLSL